MSPAGRRTFPLVARRRVLGLEFGSERSLRRGPGSDVAGSRPYRPGDDIGAIDWRTSARLSSATGRDEFIVRERFADETPRVVVLCDRRPAMSVFPPGLPWLSKPAALAAATETIAASALAAKGLVGYLDHGDAGAAFWLPPRGGAALWELLDRAGAAEPFEAPPHAVELGLEQVRRLRRDLPTGSFVFVLSDFLAPPPLEAWLAAAGHRELVPVVIQDPVWEQSFPPVGGVLLHLAEPGDGSVSRVRLTSSQASARRAANELRLVELLRGFRSLGLDPLVLGTSEPEAVDSVFLDWADERLASRRVLAS
jgi:uncharacterized protein (DUF58 family)